MFSAYEPNTRASTVTHLPWIPVPASRTDGRWVEKSVRGARSLLGLDTKYPRVTGGSRPRVLRCLHNEIQAKTLVPTDFRAITNDPRKRHQNTTETTSQTSNKYNYRSL
ncbi:hypothetical protein CBL_05225 [Carabus blaptoides fortunei]